MDKWERRDKKLKKKKGLMRKHGQELGEIYKRVTEKRKPRKDRGDSV